MYVADDVAKGVHVSKMGVCRLCLCVFNLHRVGRNHVYTKSQTIKWGLV